MTHCWLLKTRECKTVIGEGKRIMWRFRGIFHWFCLINKLLNKFLTVPEVLLRLLLRLLLAGESSTTSLVALEIVNLRLRPLASLTSAVVMTAVATFVSTLASIVAVTTFCINAFCLAANSGSRDREDLLEATGSEAALGGLKRSKLPFIYTLKYWTDRALPQSRPSTDGGAAQDFRDPLISPGSTRFYSKTKLSFCNFYSISYFISDLQSSKR